jgi:hypothetical protein
MRALGVILVLVLVGWSVVGLGGAADAAPKPRIKPVPLSFAVFDDATAETVHITATMRVFARCDRDPVVYAVVGNAKAAGASGRRYLFGGADFAEIVEPCLSTTVSVDLSFFLLPRRAQLQDSCDGQDCILKTTVSFALTFDEQGGLTTAAATAPDGPSPAAAGALAVALSFQGTPVQWGGSTPATGFDDAGLVQYAYSQVGISLPRTVEVQFTAGAAVAVGSALLPGDLVFFRDSSGSVYHVGMSLGDDRFVHAPSTGDVVKISSLNEPFYGQQYAGARRIE